MKQIFIKIIIFIVIIFEIIYPFSFTLAQFRVPVEDTGTYTYLTDLKVLLTTIQDLIATIIRDLETLNLEVGHLYELQLRSKGAELFTAIMLQTAYYNDYFMEVESLRNAQIVDSDEDIADELFRAEIAGAYEAIAEVARSINCISPEIRTELIARVRQAAAPFGLSDFAEEQVNSIPDCYSIGNSTEVFLPLNLFSSFSIGRYLAQTTNPSSGETVPTIIIQPTLRQTELSDELISAASAFEQAILGKAQLFRDRRREQLRGVRPLTESCADERYYYTDEGLAVCSNYRADITLDHLDEFLRQVQNPLLQNFTSEFIFFNFVNQRDTLRRLGITTSSYLAVDLFIDEETRKKIIEQMCSFIQKKEDKLKTVQTDFYLRCLRTLTEIAQNVVDARIKGLEERKKFAEEVRDQARRTLERIRSVRGQLNSCSGTRAAIGDLDRMERDTENYIDILTDLQRYLERVIAQLRNIFNQIFSFFQELIDLINNLVKQITEFLPEFQKEAIQDILNKIIKEIIEKTLIEILKALLGAVIPIFNWLIKLLDELPKIIKGILEQLIEFKIKLIEDVIEKIFKPEQKDLANKLKNEVNAKLNELMRKANIEYENLANENLNLSQIRLIQARLEAINKMLDAYLRLYHLRNQDRRCGGGGNISSLPKKVIIVEAETNKNLNLLDRIKYSLTYLFKVKSLEINIKR